MMVNIKPFDYVRFPWSTDKYIVVELANYTHATYYRILMERLTGWCLEWWSDSFLIKVNDE